MRKTKIICTLGPASASDDIVRELMLSGMNVARFNFSHSTHEEHKKRYHDYSQNRKFIGQIHRTPLLSNHTLQRRLLSHGQSHRSSAAGPH